MDQLIENDILFQPVEILRPSATHLAALKRLKLLTLKQLLFHLPHYYLYKLLYPSQDKIKPGDYVILKISVIELKTSHKRGGPLRVAALTTDNIPVQLIFFNKVPNFIYQLLISGKRLTVEGKIERNDNIYQILHPEFITSNNNLHPIQPIYPLTYGITQKQLYKYILQGLALARNAYIAEYKPYFAEDFLTCLSVLHKKINPTEKLSHSLALHYSGLFELTANQLAFKITKTYQQQTQGRKFISDKTTQQQILKNLGFVPTDGQKQVLAEIEADQALPFKMVRMLQGDVGSGKTLVALLSIVNVVSAKAQAAIMAPTDLLARQHYLSFQKATANTDINVALLTGSTKIRERRKLLTELKSGAIDILIGTHALFQEAVEFHDLGYIIIDEQHRFGVQQRLELINKSNNADLLVMTATPIPRSLTLALYGDMDVSRLNGKLADRLPITTSVVGKKTLSEVTRSLERIIARNEQIYWVCPLIENLGDETSIEEANYATSAAQRFEHLSSLYPSITGLLHGKMANDVKNRVMEQFNAGELKILVATTVIEVGIDVAAASLIIIENAEKFGLAALHQLRGRVGRSNKPSFCILMYDDTHYSAVAKQRLKVMKDSQDGFYIAEQDLLLRGAGEILGTKQSGEIEFSLVAPEEVRSFELITKANHIAANIFKTASKPTQNYLLRLFDKNIGHMISG